MQTIISRFVDAKEEHLRTKRTPFVCATWAQSLDGYIAASPGMQTIISCDESMRMTHELRAEHDSIMVGVGTILSDNPRLNARLSTSKKSPMPVILDTGLRTPLDAKFLKIEREKRSILYTSGLAVEETAENRTRREKFNDFNQIADVRTAPMHGEGKGLDFGAILQDLSQSNVDSIMVEGGSKVLTTVLVSGFADYIIVTVAPRMFGGGVPATRHAGAGYILPDVSDAQWHQVGDDIVLSGIPAKK